MNGNQLNRSPLGISGNGVVDRPASSRSLLRRIAATAVAVLMLGALSPAAQAASVDDASARQRAARAGMITGDLLLIRPAGFVMSLFGLGLFVPTSILCAVGGWDNVKPAYELLIREPFRVTFQRPLGEV